MVGQRFITGLEGHPYFELASVMASEKSAGKKYAEAAKWYLDSGIPGDVAGMSVDVMDASQVSERKLDLVFSAIPSEFALDTEAAFAEHVPLFSNTKTYRMVDDVPLVLAEVNPDHMQLVKTQQKNRGWGGYITTNANCTTIGFVLPLKPVFDELGVRWVNMTSMQALSGAGYDGVPSMAIVDNLIPFIKNEEPKCEIEPLKILGKLEGGRIKNADFGVIASCNRVPVLDGHTISVLAGTEKDFDEGGVKKIFRKFNPLKGMNLPTAPDPPIIVREEDDRPQPRRDRMAGGGMAESVGRIGRKGDKILCFTCLSHNTIRGAAGASILNAELAREKGLL